MGIALNHKINFENTDILTILSFPVHEHGIFLHLFVYSLISFTSVLQAIPAAQFQKNKRPNQKMGQRTKQRFLQRRHTDG